MKLSPIAANQTQVELKNGTVVLFSYKTPVAAFVPGQGYVRTKTQYSRTTSKHINKWVRAACCGAVDQSYIDELVGL